uniref:NADH-ubiquinone oxidoreductase chain 4 n=1 Tax=Auchenoplax crinita TaxID=397536 RepID=G8XXL6_AUCCR|nr:NADH dehydrogenase subunit 4 [Auchenoplax crinita]
MLKFMLTVSILLLLPMNMSVISMWVVSITVLLMMAGSMVTYFPMGSNKMVVGSDFFFFFDGLSVPLILLTLWVFGVMLIASFKVFQPNYMAKFFVFNLILLNLVLMMCFSISNLGLFYIMFESSFIPTVVMILVWGYQPERLQASSYFILYTVTASLPLLLGLMMLYSCNSSLSMYGMIWALPVSLEVSNIWWMMCVLAFLVKLPLYMVHLWLPKAHVEAPVAGSMILAAVLLKLGSYGLMRLSSLFPELSVSLVSFLGSLCMIGACVTSVICLRQPDMKSMIAYSSVGHMGFVIIGVLSCSLWGWYGAVGLMVAHGLCSSGMFCIANTVYEYMSTRSLILVKGLLTIFPCMSIWWFMLCIANMSAPPTFNLLSEIFLLVSILKSSLLLSFLFVISSVMVCAFSLVLYTITQHGSLSNFMGSFSYSFSRNYLLMVLHIAPLYFMVLHPYGFFEG